jgi:sugar-specific transcriptional regulator TrmB
MFKTLVRLGLTKKDAQVYVFLAQTGPQKARDIAHALEMYKRQLYRSLKKLQNKGIVSATLERPAKFSAVPFEKVLDIFAKAKIEEAQLIEQNKEEILSKWQSMIMGDFTS